jgi:hypothetical protein
MSDGNFGLSSPANIPVRPLNKGMMSDLPPNSLPMGAFSTIQNYFPTPKGLKRRPGFSYYAGGNRVGSGDWPFIDLAPLWKTDGTNMGCLLTSRYFYHISGFSAPSVRYWTYATGYVSNSGAAVTGYGTQWALAASRIIAGDILVFDADGTPEYATILSVDNDYTITLSAAPVGTYAVTQHIENSDCEAAASPTLDGIASAAVASTWARSAAKAKYGSYSWLLTKDASANPGYVYLDDVGHGATNDLHGLTAGAAYTFYAWVYTNAATPANVDLVLEQYYSAAWHDAINVSPTTASEWNLVTGAVTLNAGSTGVSLKFQIAGAETSKIAYLDRIVLIEGLADNDYSIRRTLHADDDTLLDYTIADNKLAIADYHRSGLYSYDGATLTEWSSSLFYTPSAVLFFADRLWIANTIESGVYYRQRIRWSSATDHTTFDAADYYDLPYFSSHIRRLLPIGRALVAYAKDAVYFGTPSNKKDLPYEFITRIDTGGIGLVGPRAITSALNGHFWIGQDDAYFTSADGTVKKMNCPVREEMIGQCTKPERIYLATDPLNDRIALGFPTTGSEIERIWTYNYKTNAWAYDVVNAQFINNPLLELSLTWDDLTAYLAPTPNDTAMSTFGSWDTIGGRGSTRRLFRGSGGYIWSLSDSATSDEGTNIPGIIETGDMDLDMPDDDKTFMRLSVRLAERPSVQLTFTVTSSLDGGYTWTTQNVLVVPANHIEGRVDFVVSGSAARFRLSETSLSAPYEIIEMVLRVLKRGIENEHE